MIIDNEKEFIDNFCYDGIVGKLIEIISSNVSEKSIEITLSDDSIISCALTHNAIRILIEDGNGESVFAGKGDSFAQMEIPEFDTISETLVAFAITKLYGNTF